MRTTVADVVADSLYRAGVRHVFGLPGGETVELLDAFRRRGFEFILVHNESSALFMADGYARTTGKLAVCLTTLGPGAANAVVGMAHAHLDRVPVILITAQKPDVLLPDYTHQIIDLHALFAPISKASIQITQANPSQAVSEAMRLATEGRPGPVHLQLSNEDAVLPAAPESAVPVHPAQGPASSAPQTSLALALDLLQHARRPLIVAGLGLEPQRPYELLREFAEQIDAPVLVTPKAKGALPDSHPLAAGVIGLTRTDPAYVFLEEADCVLAVGFDVVELVKPWALNAPLIWLAPWQNRDPVLPHVASLVGDIGDYLAKLLDAAAGPTEPAEASPDRTTWGRTRIAAYRARPRAALPSAQPSRLLPQTVLAHMRAVLPPETRLVVDVGSHKIFSSLEWPTLAPNTFYLSNGLSSMAFSLPAAIGAQLGDPATPTVCLIGDAGMAMVMGELGLLAQRQLPILVIVLNDGAIDLIRAQQVRAGKPAYGTVFAAPNFARIGAAYGLSAHRVTTADEFDAALAEFIRQPRPMLVEVMLDPTSYPTTPRAPSRP